MGSIAMGLIILKVVVDLYLSEMSSDTNILATATTKPVIRIFFMFFKRILKIRIRSISSELKSDYSMFLKDEIRAKIKINKIRIPKLPARAIIIYRVIPLL